MPIKTITSHSALCSIAKAATIKRQAVSWGTQPVNVTGHRPGFAAASDAVHTAAGLGVGCVS
jgi:hypothetical protein